MAIIHNLIARFRADTGTFDRNVKKSRTHMTRFGRDVHKMGRQMLMMAGVGGGLYALQRGFKAIVKAASDAEETQAKFNTVFRNLSTQANKWAEDFGQSVGRANQSVKSWMAGLQDTFVPLGIARDEAMQLSQSLVKLAVDVASFNNKVDADVIRDFTSALVGNHETVRKYGIIISESAIKQEAYRQGIEKTYKELTDLEKVQLRYALIQRGTIDAQGDAIRTSSSYANQLKRLSANWNDFKVMLGNEVLPALAGLLESINENAEAFEKLAKAIAAPITSLKILIDLYKLLPEPKAVGETGRWYPAPSPTIKPAIPLRPSLPIRRPTGEELVRQRVIEAGRKQMAIMEESIEVEKGLQELRAIGRKRLLDGLIKESKKRNEVAENQRRIYTNIARGMAGEWSNAFDSMLFEGEKFAEAMTDLLRGILRMVTQILTYEMIAKPIAAGMMGMPASELHSGGIVGQTAKTRRVPALAFAGAPRLHGGFAGDEYPAILQRGETVIPRGGGGMAPIVNIFNESGTRLRQESEPMFDGKQWVIRIVADDIQQGGTLRKMFKGIR